MAAWSAKVSTSAICLSVNGLTSCVINDNDTQQVIAFEYRHPENCADCVESFCAERILRIGQDIGNVDRSAFERGAGRTTVRGRGELDFALQIP